MNVNEIVQQVEELQALENYDTFDYFMVNEPLPKESTKND